MEDACPGPTPSFPTSYLEINGPSQHESVPCSCDQFQGNVRQLVLYQRAEAHSV